MEIKSAENGTKLILEAINRNDSAADQLSVRIDGARFSGMKSVYIHNTSSLLAPFLKFRKALDASDTHVRWESIEEDLSVELYHRDSLGHICLNVSLRENCGNPPWSVSTELILELGLFDSLVADLQALLDGLET